MTPEISIVIPVFNEAQNLEALHADVTRALGSWDRTYEVVAIDDGSTDESFARLAAIRAADPRWRIIRFRRNFGQTAAFAAGIAAAAGSLIVTADGDRQNDPRDIPMMVDRLAPDVDIVCGWRRARKDAFVTRRVPSKIANWLISAVTGVRLHDYGCSLKVFRADVLKPLKLYGEMHRFLPALASEMGVRIIEVPVNHRPRTQGRSKYGLSRTVRVLLDLLAVKFLLSYSTRPLQIFGVWGLAMGSAGTVILAYLAWIKFSGHSIGGRPLLLFGILLALAGVQLVTLGLLAELQARAYRESQGKPAYVIRETLG